LVQAEVQYILNGTGQGITKIGRDIQTNVTFIQIRFTDITTIRPNAFSAFMDLKGLDLSVNNISVVSDFAFAGTKLSRLYLHINSIIALPANAFAGSEISYLYLNQNSISVLPDNIFSGTNIAYLYLHGNKLTMLPDLSTDSLQYLQLAFNPISLLPKENLLKLTHLNTLHLYSTHINEIPNFKGMQNLRGLNIFFKS
jgi:Leucine-rich repeat (LRR) protein